MGEMVINPGAIDALDAKKVDLTALTGDSIFSVSYHIVNTSGTDEIAANSSVLKEVTVTKAGWYPLGIIGSQVGGSGVTVTAVQASYVTDRTVGSCITHTRIRNLSSTAYKPGVTIYVLWYKTPE